MANDPLKGQQNSRDMVQQLLEPRLLRVRAFPPAAGLLEGSGKRMRTGLGRVRRAAPTTGSGAARCAHPPRPSYALQGSRRGVWSRNQCAILILGSLPTVE